MKVFVAFIVCIVSVGQEVRGQLVNFTGGENHETVIPGGVVDGLPIGPQYNGDSSGYGVPPDEVTIMEKCTDGATTFDLRFSFSLTVSPISGQTSASGLEVNPPFAFNVASACTFILTGSMTEVGDTTLSMSNSLADVPTYEDLATQRVNSASPNSSISFVPESGSLLASSTNHSYIFEQTAIATAPTNGVSSDQTTVTGYYDLMISTTPEPSAAALIALPFLSLLMGRRRACLSSFAA